jgi:hypothetical protein
VRYWSVPRFLQACQAEGPRGARGEEIVPFAADARLTAEAESADLLVLDEVLSAHTSEWGRAKLETLVDARWVAGRPLVAVVTGAPSELAAWSPRLASRLGDAALGGGVVLNVSDYRTQRRRAG